MSMGTLECGDFDLWGMRSQSPLGKGGQQDPESRVPLQLRCPLPCAALHLPRNVVEMYSETWFPDLLISDRCVSSRFSILLN